MQTMSTTESKKIGVSNQNLEMSKTMRLTLLAMFTALMILLSFFGSINVGVFKITFMTLPIIVGATILKPLDSAILGAVFGLSSFIQAVLGMSALATALFQIDPFMTFILCFVPRVLDGYLSGLIFQGIKKIDKTNLVSYITVGAAVPLLNTILFMGTLFLFFYNSAPIQAIAQKSNVDNIFALFVAMVGINAVVELLVGIILGTAVSKALNVAIKRSLRV